MSDDCSSLSGFDGVARLFPLPNLVLFPHVMQPLHIFEPRYRQMTADALAGDRLIAVVLLEPGWEADYAGAPRISDVACLGKIVAEQRLDDGRYNILLRGQSRIHINHELASDTLYRQARVDLLDDADSPTVLTQRKLRRRLLRCVPAWLPKQKEVIDQFRKLLKSEMPLGALCDIVAFALPLDIHVKQELLEELSVERRLRSLLRHLESKQCTEKTRERTFPPEFSLN